MSLKLPAALEVRQHAWKFAAALEIFANMPGSQLLPWKSANVPGSQLLPKESANIPGSQLLLLEVC